MESDIVRRAANAARVPLTMVRAVLDTADQPLPEYLLKLTTPTGRIRPFPLAALLLRRPSALRELRQLRRSSRIALDALGNAVRDLLTDT